MKPGTTAEPVDTSVAKEPIINPGSFKPYDEEPERSADPID